jgi:hypothetical protein
MLYNESKHNILAFARQSQQNGPVNMRQRDIREINQGHSEPAHTGVP